MAAPTNTAYSNSNATDNVSTAEVTGSVSWNLGDVVVVLGVTEDNIYTMGVPTTSGSGLSFSAVSGFPTNTASNTRVHAWSATASATSSGTISVAKSDANAARHMVAAVWVYSGSGGIGNAATQVGDTTSPVEVSLTRAGNNSAVVLVAGDWTPVSDTAVDASPSAGSTERLSDNAGFATNANFYFIDWSDQGAAGTTSYGIANLGGSPKVTLGAVEIKGSVGGGTVGGPCFDGRTFRGLTFGRVLSAPLSRETRMMAEADRLWRRDRELRRAA